MLSSRHLGWTSEPQLTPAEFSAPGPGKGSGLVGGPERAEKGSSIVEPRAVVTQAVEWRSLEELDSRLLGQPFPSHPLLQTGSFIQGTPKEREIFVVLDTRWPHLREAAWHSLSEPFYLPVCGTQ